MTVPSAHRYYLPRDSASWTFFWVTFRHDYIVPRLRDKLRESGSVLSVAPDSRLVALAVSLSEIWRHGRGDAFAEEGALFEFLMEFERFVHTSSFRVDERERWLSEARTYVFSHLERTVDVDELAALYGMSRSYYAHRFKAATGRSPARWIQQVRLEEATRRLVHTDEKLEAVARGTGLQNANHFCKVFRRHFRLSPGEFRRQMR
jgi:AraC-like DNA-binding protein